jgi:hypothetical protein
MLFDWPRNRRYSDRHMTWWNRFHDDGIRSYAAVVADLDVPNDLGTGAYNDTVADTRSAITDAKIA